MDRQIRTTSDAPQSSLMDVSETVIRHISTHENTLRRIEEIEISVGKKMTILANLENEKQFFWGEVMNLDSRIHELSDNLNNSNLYIIQLRSEVELLRKKLKDLNDILIHDLEAFENTAAEKAEKFRLGPQSHDCKFVTTQISEMRDQGRVLDEQIGEIDIILMEHLAEMNRSAVILLERNHDAPEETSPSVLRKFIKFLEDNVKKSEHQKTMLNEKLHEVEKVLQKTNSDVKDLEKQLAASGYEETTTQ